MKRFLSYFVVFVLGFVVCAGVLLRWYGPPSSYTGPVVAPEMPTGSVSIAKAGNNQVRFAADKISHYVVNIDTVGHPIHEIPDFFGFPFGGGEREFIPKGQASGVIFSPDGHIITNEHVVKGAAKLTVTLFDGTKYPARLIGSDPRTDLAVIKIDPKRRLPFARFSRNKIAVGDWVIAVGNALGLGPTVTVGVVSAWRKEFDIDGKTFEGIIQTDAAINRGNSGGALGDLNGNLVGINTAIASTAPGGGNIGIGFAIPSSTAQKIADQLVKKGRIIRPWLGIRYTGLNEEVRKVLRERGVTKLPKEDGALIIEVYTNSPAAEAGLQPQDVILKINGKPVSSKPKGERGKVTVASEVRKAKVGDRLLMDVWHAANARVGTVGVRVGEMPAEFGEQP